MPPCRVDATTSTKYAALVERLCKKTVTLRADLVELYDKIASDYRRGGDCIPRLKHPKIAGKIWKYRVADKADNRGKSYAFRVIGYLADSGVMYMVFIYPKAQQDDVTADEIRRLVIVLEVSIAEASTGPAPPSGQ